MTDSLQVAPANGTVAPMETSSVVVRKAEFFTPDCIRRLMVVRDLGETHFLALQREYERRIRSNAEVHKQNFRRHIEWLVSQGLVSMRILSRKSAIRDGGGRPARRVLKITDEGRRLIEDYETVVNDLFPPKSTEH